MYTHPIKLTNETKLREFQFKFLNRIVPNNSFLFKCKIASPSLCDFCYSYLDSLHHMFWECQCIQIFWTAFSSQILVPLNITNKRAQRALGRSPEEKVKGQGKAIYRGSLMLSIKYWYRTSI